MKNIFISDKFWSISSAVLCLVLMMPLLSIIYLAIESNWDVWHHLIKTSLFHYFQATGLLLVGVGFIVFFIGVGTAWLVTMHDFPFKSSFEWFLIFPLAFPSYVVAYAYTDLLEFSGVIQSSLRSFFDWGIGDYWFPDIRSLTGASIVMGFVLYPYVYLLARSAFLELSVSALEANRVLGGGPCDTFVRVALPSARPAIIVGMSLALMETMNDYGTVDFFAVPTLTVGLIDVWLGMNSLSGAAQIASLTLSIVLIILIIEQMSRANQRLYQQGSTRFSKLPIVRLKGFKGYFALGYCAVPVLIGFVIPLIILARLSFLYFGKTWTDDFLSQIGNSILLSSVAALFVILISLFLGYGKRLTQNQAIKMLISIAKFGYGIPGAVIAMGVLIPFAYFDNSLNDLLVNYFGISSGLILSGSIMAILFAYVVRFLFLGLGQIESSLEKISPTMDMAFRSLGNTKYETLLKLHLPMLKGGILVAGILVFVDCMKELPATLILRPFNFDTLAINVYQYASDEMLGEAATGSLIIVTIGLLPVVILSKLITDSRKLSR
ncbi:iron ABC transporter permease [Pseudomonadota bacterium]|nr:iron ABC transporter permease [Pseudomonadota bacterium]